MDLKNVYDIRFFEKLYFTLPKNYRIAGIIKNIFSSACVIIYLYYQDSLSRFREYIKNAVKKCDVCIITSNKELYLEAVKRYSANHNLQVRLKQNRGRDVAALLVTARDLFDDYQYICFVHDKKEKALIWKNATDEWVSSLWECTLGSENYIQNIISFFESNDEIGLLVPPEMIDLQTSHWYMNSWGDDYEITLQLAQKLGLKTDIKENKPPISLGTVFWCRSVALKKLWNINWTYELFDDEPLPNDGTISHAIERIFPYAVQDAGFKTGTVMTEEETARVLSFAQLGMHSFYEILSDELGIEHIDDALKYQTRTIKLHEYYKRHKKIYIYGNGTIGKRYLKLIRHLHIPVAGFIVSDKNDINNESGLSVYSISEISGHIINEKCGIVIGVSNLYSSEVIEILQRYHINDYLVI